MSLNNLYYSLKEYLLLTTKDPLRLASGDGWLIIGSHDNQNTTNMPNSVRGQYRDGQLAGIDYADQRHWKHGTGG